MNDRFNWIYGGTITSLWICKAINDRTGELVEFSRESFMIACELRIEKIFLLPKIHYRLMEFLPKKDFQKWRKKSTWLHKSASTRWFTFIGSQKSSCGMRMGSFTPLLMLIYAHHTHDEFPRISAFCFAFQWLSCLHLVIWLSSRIRHWKWEMNVEWIPQRWRHS